MSRSVSYLENSIFGSLVGNKYKTEYFNYLTIIHSEVFQPVIKAIIENTTINNKKTSFE